MRILHFADLHIGVENYGHIDPETGLSTRLLDFLQALDEVVEYALSQNIDLVLLAGDAYKSRDPNQTHQRELAKRLATLSSAGIPIFLLLGNHDRPNAIGRATAIEIFDTLQVPNLYVGDEIKTYVVETPKGSLQITALPWPRRSMLFSRKIPAVSRLKKSKRESKTSSREAYSRPPNAWIRKFPPSSPATSQFQVLPWGLSAP